MEHPLEHWKADWSVSVYHRSSNGKEIRTLDLTLECAQYFNPEAVANTTFFYFTDNLVCYFAVTSGASRSPGLQALVESIKAREEDLGCVLEPVHVPGTTIIEEGSDDLSRGIWSTPLHEQADRLVILSEIFAPVPYSPDVGTWACNQAGLTGIPWQHQCWDQPWHPKAVLGHLTVWAPPPEVAAQLLSFLLKCYEELPLTTSALILVPRVLQRRWSRASCQVVKIGVYPRSLIPFVCRTALTIPVVLLIVPFHVRRLEPARLDLPSCAPSARVHREQAALVRGVLEAIEAV